MSGEDAVSAWLLGRADSYGSDAVTLRQEGDTTNAIAYETIRDELRRCAAEIKAR